LADLDKERIAAAALSVVDAGGLAGFTMRAVAEALGVTPMALYHHVEDKAALAVLVVDAANTERALPPPTGVWQDDLWGMARWMRESMLAHPHVAQLRRTWHVWTPSVLRMTERWLNLWQQSGLDLDKAVLAANTSSMAIVGVMDEEMIFRDMKPPGDDMLSWLPSARVAFYRPHDRSAEFELIVRAVIEGIYARLARGS
jgi:AcrR family transcriptional regulator